MSDFWETLARDQYGSAAFWILVLVVAGVFYVLHRIISAISDVKCAKYESFSSYIERGQELSSFYSWLVYNYENLDAEADPDHLAKDYLNSRIGVDSD